MKALGKTKLSKPNGNAYNLFFPFRKISHLRPLHSLRRTSVGFTVTEKLCLLRK